MINTPNTVSRENLLQMQRGDVSVKSTALIIFIQGISTTPALMMYGSQGHPTAMAFEYVLCFFTYLITTFLIWKVGDRSEWYEKPKFYSRKILSPLCITLLSPIFATFLALSILGGFFPYLSGYAYSMVLGLSALFGTTISLIALFIIVILLYR